MPDPVQDPSRPDRYEPLPGIAALPGWIWRRLPRAGKIGVALLPLVAVALALALAPGIDRSKDERRQTQAERLARQRAEHEARIQAEQRPRFGRGAAAGSDLRQRASLFADARVAVEVDARRRVAAGALEGPIRKVECEPYPRSLESRAAHLDPASEAGRYACLAVTNDVRAGQRTEASTIGHPYRLKIDFVTGRYALCKISGRPGEGSIGAQPVVTVPPACGRI
jgi:hypothetical protein